MDFSASIRTEKHTSCKNIQVVIREFTEIPTMGTKIKSTYEQMQGTLKKYLPLWGRPSAAPIMGGQFFTCFCVFPYLAHILVRMVGISVDSGITSCIFLHWLVFFSPESMLKEFLIISSSNPAAFGALPLKRLM